MIIRLFQVRKAAKQTLLGVHADAKEIECICCQEIAFLSRVVEDLPCVTEHSSFHEVCLNRMCCGLLWSVCTTEKVLAFQTDNKCLTDHFDMLHIGSLHGGCMDIWGEKSDE